MEPPDIYLPEAIIEPVSRILRLLSRIDRGRLPCKLLPALPGDEIELSREHVVTVSSTTHTVPLARLRRLGTTAETEARVPGPRRPSDPRPSPRRHGRHHRSPHSARGLSWRQFACRPRRLSRDVRGRGAHHGANLRPPRATGRTKSTSSATCTSTTCSSDATSSTTNWSSPRISAPATIPIKSATASPAPCPTCSTTVCVCGSSAGNLCHSTKAPRLRSWGGIGGREDVSVNSRRRSTSEKPIISATTEGVANLYIYVKLTSIAYRQQEEACGPSESRPTLLSVILLWQSITT